MNRLVNITMALVTNRNNMIAVLSGVSFRMMILLAWFWAKKTLQSAWMRKKATFNCVPYKGRCDFLFSMATIRFPRCSSPFFAAGIFVERVFEFLCVSILSAINSLIFSVAVFAIILMSSGRFAVFVKIGKWFNFFAFCADFCLNWLRHSFSLIKVTFRAIHRHIPVCGSFYYIPAGRVVNA